MLIKSVLFLSLFISSFSYAQLVDKKTNEAIVQGLTSNVPNLPKIDEIKITPLPGIYEVRHSGTELFYSSGDGSYIIQGALIDTKNKKNITEDRISVITAMDFKALPFKDSFKIVKGNGKRKIAIFEDPNCGYCKQFETQVESLKDVTIYLFLYPILGPDSVLKSNNVWCSKDQKKAWQDWMIRGVKPLEEKCAENPLERNLEFGKKNKINGTPTLIFEDGTRVPGVISVDQIEEKFKNLSKNKNS